MNMKDKLLESFHRELSVELLSVMAIIITSFILLCMKRLKCSNRTIIM